MRLTLDPARDIDAALLHYRRVFGYLFVFSAVITLTQIVPTIYSMQLFDRVMTSRNETTLVMLTLIVLGLFAVNAVIEWVRNEVMIRISAGFDRLLGGRVFAAAFERSLREADANPAQVLADLGTLRQFVTGAAMLALLDVPWIPLFVAMAFLFHPWLGWFTVAGSVLLIVLTVLNEWLTRDAMAEANRLSGKASTYMNATLQNPEVIQAMGMLGVMQARLEAQQRRVVQLQTSASSTSAWITSVTRLVRSFWQASAMALGALMVLEGKITMGMMSGVSLLFFRAMVPIETAIGSWKQFGAARAAYGRLTRLLADYPAARAMMQLPPPTGEISVQQAVITPPGAPQPVVNGATFTLAKGEVMAIIGPSASGKSSLARALVGVWKPVRGSVRYDGAELSQWPTQALGPHLGYLPQDVELFDGPIADNIARFGVVDAERVIDAAKQAGIHDMILQLPAGYDTVIGATGIKLSGGQRQRLGLARAMYGTPAVVVLDEPNSNLDDEGDAALIRAIGEMKARGSTVVLVTHRPSILRAVDKLLFLRGGIQQAFGPRDQVLRALLPTVAGKSPDEAASQGLTGTSGSPAKGVTPLRPVPNAGGQGHG